MSVFTSICFLLLFSGCMNGFPTEDLPAEINFVISNAMELRASSSDALTDVPAGRVVQALGELSGCWAAAQPVIILEAPPSDSPVPPFEVLQYLHFDSATGELTRSTFQRLFFFDLLGIQTGPVEIINESVIRFEVRTFVGNVPLTRELVDILDQFSDPVVYDIQATRDDATIKLSFVLAEDDPATPAGFADELEYLFRSVDCVD